MVDAETVRIHPVVRALRPVRLPYYERLSKHSDLTVWHVDAEFQEAAIPAELLRRWSAPEIDAAETWRKRPLLVGEDSGCPYSCGEVEIAARLRAAGMAAYWISEWSGFPHVECWRPFCVKRCEFRNGLPELWERDMSLRAGPYAGTLGRAGGHPDIVCLADSDALYVEYKGPGDSIKQKQNDWAAAAVTAADPRLAYIAVRGIIRQADSSTQVVAVSPASADPERTTAATPGDNARPKIASGARSGPSKPRKDKLHRRIIADTLKRERGWGAVSRVDGWVDFSPARSTGSLGQFVEEVRAAVINLGYSPTVRITTDRSGRQWIRVHTPETLDQAGRGAHSR
jgi:hypothetical protein